jgi:hypothetical protein
MKDVARLWNDRKIMEDFASKAKMESKAILSSYMSKEGFDILQKLEKRDEINPRQVNSSVSKTSSTTVYI